VAGTRIAKLEGYGLLQVAGDDARAFLHAQLTNDVANLAAGNARFAGWCSAKGRLLATFLLIPSSGGFLLQLSRDLVAPVAKRLQMFVLRSKVGIGDASAQWTQFGVWRPDAGEPLSVSESGEAITVGIEPGRSLVLAAERAAGRFVPNAPAAEWTLAEIRAGRPLIAAATQDQFVPQMVNLELAGGVDFHKGCYPGQEVVARAQYRGAVKRRMVRLRGAALQPGQEIYSDDQPGQPSGMVVNASGDESLVVLQTGTIDARAPVRARPGADALEILPLPYGR
jgi:folate-binding protein YgfZ